MIRVPKEDGENIPERDDLPGFWTDADFVIGRQMKIMENTEYLAEAVPYHHIDMSANAMIFVLGAEIDYPNKETLWAHPSIDSLRIK